MANTMAGRRFFITGGAAGIGRATADLLIREGARVAIFDLDAEAADRTAGEIGAIALCGDVSREDDVEAAAGKAAELLGGIDGLVCSAGVEFRYPIRNAPIEKWRRTVDINLTGVFLACHFALRFMEQEDHGTIVNVSSAAALRASAGRAAYVAAKGGVTAFTKTLSQEVAPKIRANVVSPGPVDTALFREGVRDAAARHRSEGALALKRIGQIEEIAQVIHYLSCSQSAFTTGAMLVANGGGKHVMM